MQKLLGSILCLLACHAGCERPPIGPGGVIGVFGKVGIAPGAFSYPRAITVARNGDVFVVDKSARVQRFSPDGTFETSWKMPEKVAGKPVGLTVHPDGRVFVADTHYHRVIVFDPDGNELTRFGEYGTGDGQFLLPTDVAIDADGFIYVSEYNGNDRITKWEEIGTEARRHGGAKGEVRFVGTLIEGEVGGRPLRRPAALDIDDEQTLWVADACNHRILRFTLDGRLLNEFGQMGKDAGQMRYPYDIDVDQDGNVMVCEYGNSRLQWFDAQGHSLRTWGRLGRRLGELNSPWGAARSLDGTVYVVDSLN
ncbi:MAG: SMP-30/gluconolactonase/LRE family protein, partial [Planctomycetes bacterium]|nr:SMP-30/gluconolactonase/LRE family protein [Planctomycetota bacterium]